MSHITTHTTAEMKKAARRILKSLLHQSKDLPLIIALSGDLGAGKTTFVQGCAQALRIRTPITSPTFTLLQRYEIPKKESAAKGRTELVHIDCYRLTDVRETTGLNLKEVLSRSRAIIFIEWPERIKELLPENTIWISFSHGGQENERAIDLLESRDKR